MPFKSKMPAEEAVEQKAVKKPAKFRYACYGCTKNAGWFDEPAMNLRVICPHCQMDQLSKLENFIYEENRQ